MIGRDIILGLNFHPHTVFCFINDKAALFSNNIFDLCDVFGNDMSLLHEALLSDNDLTARINILETFLVTKLRKCKIEEKRTAFLDYIITSLIKELTILNKMRKMVTKTGYSERNILRLFTDYIGITPKELNKIHSFLVHFWKLNSLSENGRAS